uniref:Anaphase-promoting complex subunit 4 WD40 domain-containing protein n=1 Tax=Setaria digitata TaxID=48799 RepID=A0A915PSL3_9BILA
MVISALHLLVSFVAIACGELSLDDNNIIGETVQERGIISPKTKQLSTNSTHITYHEMTNTSEYRANYTRGFQIPIKIYQKRLTKIQRKIKMFWATVAVILLLWMVLTIESDPFYALSALYLRPLRQKYSNDKEIMAFFLRNRSGGNSDPKVGNKLKRKLPGPKLSKRRTRLANEDIPSDDDDIFYDDVGKRVKNRSDEEEEEYEDVQETAYRKAKQLLDDIQAEEQNEENESYNNEMIAHRLRDDALSKVATLHRRVANDVRLSGTAVQYRAHRYSTVAVVISHDDRYVVSCSKDAKIVKYDLEEGKIIAFTKYNKGDNISHQGQIFSLAISAGDKYLASGGTDTIIRVWNFSNLEHVKNLSGHMNAVTGLAFRLNTQQLYSCSKDRTVKLWDLEQLGYIDTLFGHVDGVVGIDALSRERLVTAGSQDRTVRLWKVPEDSHLIFNGYSTCFSIDCVALINEDHFVSGSADGSLCVWSIFKKKPVCTQREAHGQGSDGQPRWIVSVAARRYTDLIASGSSDGFVRLWKVAEDYKSITNILSYEQVGFINHLKFSNDGEEVVCAVGQEHKYGRWWKIAGARNVIAVFSLTYDVAE